MLFSIYFKTNLIQKQTLFAILPRKHKGLPMTIMKVMWRNKSVVSTK